MDAPRRSAAARTVAAAPSAAPPAAPPPAARLAVGVVGTGRVGAVLGAALARAGHRVVAASGASPASRSRAAALLPGTPLVPAADVADAAELVLLTVPDDALPALVAVLAPSLRPGQLLAHTSGRHGVGVLHPAVRAGALPLALHPVLPFAGAASDLARLAGAAVGVTCPDELRPVAQSLVDDVGGHAEWVPEERRALWHAALAHAANHLTTLVTSSADLLREAGATRPDRVLAPLLDAALDGSLSRGDDALTGPVARGDAGTVRAHLDVLAAVAPEVLPAYVAMARLTADRALAAGVLEVRRAGPLLEVLGSVGASR